MQNRAIKTNIADSLDIVVHIERRPGQRFIAEVLALHGFSVEDDRYDFESVYRRESETLPSH